MTPSRQTPSSRSISWSGGAGGIDLGQVATDDVDADEDEAVPFERGRERSTDLEVALRERALDAGRADVDVAGQLARPGERARWHPPALSRLTGDAR
jgi:hypothetical protein